MLLYSITIANFQKNNFDMLCFDDHKKTRSKSSHMLRIGGVALDFKVGAITEAKIVKLKTVKLKRFQFFISISLQHQSKQFVEIRV